LLLRDLDPFTLTLPEILPLQLGNSAKYSYRLKHRKTIIKLFVL
jgi:hypothetical protein